MSGQFHQPPLNKGGFSMQIARIEWQGRPRWALRQEDTWHAIEGELWGQKRAGAPLCAVDEARYLAPIEPHNKVIGLGITYKRMWDSYQRREGPCRRDGPAVFMKPPNTVIAHGEPIVQHAICQMLIYEAEVGVVIGKTASRLTPENALQHVAGYTCVNDVTCARFYNEERPIISTRFKIADTFCPIGPYIETDMNPEDITVLCRVNGQEMERSNTGQDLCYSIAELLAWVTSFMTLQPGDVVATGSNGTGPIRPGDSVDVEIEHLGVLRNSVVAG
jgi:2-keto-4-pentenoate hydratase/2-oxohepta-3-ene-1,7-dioic acid hydratase in catechol pathway